MKMFVYGCYVSKICQLFFPTFFPIFLVLQAVASGCFIRFFSSTVKSCYNVWMHIKQNYQFLTPNTCTARLKRITKKKSISDRNTNSRQCQFEIKCEKNEIGVKKVFEIKLSINYSRYSH